MINIAEKITTTIHEIDTLINPWLVFSILVVVSLILILPVLSRTLISIRQLTLINRLGVDSLHNVILPDSMGGSVYIEHLVLNHNGIGIYQIKNYTGNIFAAEKIDTWTQVVGNRSYKFPNPLSDIEEIMVAVRAQANNTPVYAKILVNKNANFPKGKPDIITMLNEIDIDDKTGKIPEETYVEWQNIRQSTQPVDKSYQHYGANEKTNLHSRWRIFFSSILFISAMTWVVITL